MSDPDEPLVTKAEVKAKLTDCSNLKDGKPKVINMFLKGSVCNNPCTFEVDSGACASVISPDLVPKDEPTTGHTHIKCIDNISSYVPCVALPVVINDIERTLHFAIHEKLSPSSVLLGRDLGEEDFTFFLKMAKIRPIPILLISLEPKLRPKLQM